MIIIPNYATLIEATFSALKILGGSGKNDEINSKVAEILELSNEVQDVPHLNSSSLSEVNYRCAWTRTILKNYGALENSARSVWTIKPEFTSIDSVDGATVEKFRNIKNKNKQQYDTAEEKMEEQGVDVPEEVKPWRKRLYEVLINMDPYGFERLTQRVLRECGFTNVVVTKKSGDGGIDGTGKLKINGIFSFNIAFQCKRYIDIVEVKSGNDYKKHKALDNVMSVKERKFGNCYVLCKGNICKEAGVTYLPWYLVMFIKQSELPNSLKYEIDLSGLNFTENNN